MLELDNFRSIEAPINSRRVVCWQFSSFAVCVWGEGAYAFSTSMLTFTHFSYCCYVNRNICTRISRFANLNYPCVLFSSLACLLITCWLTLVSILIRSSEVLDAISVQMCQWLLELEVSYCIINVVRNFVRMNRMNSLKKLAKWLRLRTHKHFELFDFMANEFGVELTFPNGFY